MTLTKKRMSEIGRVLENQARSGAGIGGPLYYDGFSAKEAMSDGRRLLQLADKLNIPKDELREFRDSALNGMLRDIKRAAGMGLRPRQ